MKIERSPYQPLPSQVLPQQEIEEDSDATVLMEDSDESVLMEDDPSVDSPTVDSPSVDSPPVDTSPPATATLVTPKTYTHKLAFEKLGRFAKRKEKTFVRDVVTPDTTKPSTEEEPKHVRVRDVQKWMTSAVGQTVFDHIDYPILEEAVRKIIADRIAGWNWDGDLQEESAFVTKKNVVMGAAESVRGMESIATVQEMLQKQIVNAIDFGELEATAIGGYMRKR